jgi:hypothetical protein
MTVRPLTKTHHQPEPRRYPNQAHERPFRRVHEGGTSACGGPCSGHGWVQPVTNQASHGSRVFGAATAPPTPRNPSSETWGSILVWQGLGAHVLQSGY